MHEPFRTSSPVWIKLIMALILSAAVIFTSAGCADKKDQDFYTKNGIGYSENNLVCYGGKHTYRVFYEFPEGKVYYTSDGDVAETVYILQDNKVKMPFAVDDHGKFTQMVTYNTDVIQSRLLFFPSVDCKYYRGYLFVHELNGYLYRMNVSKNKIRNIEQVSADTVCGFTFWDDTVYYVASIYDGFKLHSVKLDGKDDKVISDNRCQNISAWDNRLYYTSSLGKFCSSDLEGNDVKVLFDEDARDPVVYNGWIYFTVRNDGDGYVCKINVNGLSRKTIYDHFVTELKYYNGKLYFFARNDESGQTDLCSIDTDGNSFKVIKSYTDAESFSIADDRIYVVHIVGEEDTDISIDGGIPIQ